MNSFNIPTAAAPQILSKLCWLICSVCGSKFMSCTFEFIGFSVGVSMCEILVSKCLSALIQVYAMYMYVQTKQHLLNMYVRISE